MARLRSSELLFDAYVARMRKIADVKNALAVLQWDQETYLPPKGAVLRGQQMATLSELAHKLNTEKKLGSIMQNLLVRNDLSDGQRRNVQLSWEDHERQQKFTGAFVRTLSESISRAYHAWIQARKENSFSIFEKSLDALIGLKKQEADLLGYSGHPYNALLDEYEKGGTTTMLDGVFDAIREPLKTLLDQVMRAPQVNDAFLHQHYPKQQQWDFGMQVIRELGFDFEAGRQDISEHPFTTSFNVHDVRLTTRIDEQDFGNMLWSCIHEAGHGLYEQGLPESGYGIPAGEYASLSIHESQSRLWENNVGRGSAFWEHRYPALQQIFPGALRDVSARDFYHGINKVQPSLIRTEADELTYHFHVMIRYELEKKLITGEVNAHDIPACWNEKYRDYLGVQVPDDKSGCLQDVHWSHGSFGYFPTYSLGSFYAAQFFAAVEKQHPDLVSLIRKGDTSILLNWLRRHIHSQGRMLRSEALCEQACGEKLDIQYFLRYMLDKYRNIYNF